MDNFPVISKNKKELIINPRDDQIQCQLELIVENKAIEILRGVFDGYGDLKQDLSFKHLLLVDGAWTDITQATLARVSSLSHTGDVWVSESWDRINNTLHDISASGIEL